MNFVGLLKLQISILYIFHFLQIALLTIVRIINSDLYREHLGAETSIFPCYPIAVSTFLTLLEAISPNVKSVIELFTNKGKNDFFFTLYTFYYVNNRPKINISTRGFKFRASISKQYKYFHI